MNVNDLRVVKTQKALKNAMIELIKEKPLDKISVIDICSRAMVNRATFYSHYEDKYSLFEACLKEVLKPFDALVPDCASFSETKDYYIEVARVIFAHAENHKKFYESVFKKNDSFAGYLSDYVAETIFKQLNALSERGTPLSAPAEIMAAYYSGATANLVRWWVESGFKISADELCGYLDVLIQPKL